MENYIKEFNIAYLSFFFLGKIEKIKKINKYKFSAEYYGHKKKIVMPKYYINIKGTNMYLVLYDNFVLGLQKEYPTTGILSSTYLPIGNEPLPAKNILVENKITYKTLLQEFCTEIKRQKRL